MNILFFKIRSCIFNAFFFFFFFYVGEILIGHPGLPGGEGRDSAGLLPAKTPTVAYFGSSRKHREFLSNISGASCVWYELKCTSNYTTSDAGATPASPPRTAIASTRAPTPVDSGPTTFFDKTEEHYETSSH